MGRHEPGKRSDMIGIESVCEATSFYLFVLAIGHERLLTVENNHSVDDVVREFD